MDKEPYVSCVSLQTRYTDYDFCDRLRLSSLLSLIQEAAAISANEMGIGSDYLWKKDYGFIITNIAVRIHKGFRTGERLTVKNWPLKPKRVIFERDFQVYNEQGELAVDAVSRWCLFDVANQKILSEKDLPCDNTVYCDRQAFAFQNWKLPNFSSEGASPVFSYTVRPSDCDRYRHVNNTRYADFCMNAFSWEEWKANSVKAFQIVFEKQCRAGERLDIYLLCTGEKKFSILGKKENNENCFRAEIVFENS